MEKEKIDYFEEYELLGQRYPEIYQAVFEEGDLDTYEDTERLLKKLNAMGWTFDYYLDNSPYDLRPIGKDYVRDFEDFKESERLEQHPERDKIIAIQKLMESQKKVFENGGKIDYSGYLVYDNGEVQADVYDMDEESYYVEVDNKFDLKFNNKLELDRYLESEGFVYQGYEKAYAKGGKITKSDRDYLEKILHKELQDEFTKKELKNMSDKEILQQTNLLYGYIPLDNKYAKGGKISEEESNWDNFYENNPEKILGDYVDTKTKFGKKVKVLKGEKDILDKIETPDYRIDIAKDFGVSESSEQITPNTITYEEAQTAEANLDESENDLVELKEADQNGTLNENTLYTFDEVDKTYNKGISEIEKCAFVAYLESKRGGKKIKGGFEKYRNKFTQKQMFDKGELMYDFETKELQPKFLFLSGNIADKYSKLDFNKTKYITEYGKKAYDIAFEAMENKYKEVQSKYLTLDNPDEKLRLKILLSSKFAKTTKIDGYFSFGSYGNRKEFKSVEKGQIITYGSYTNYGELKKINYEKTDGRWDNRIRMQSITLYQGFLLWLKDAGDPNRAKQNGIVYRNGMNAAAIIRIYAEQRTRPKSETKERWTRIQGQAKENGDRLFAQFLADFISTEDRRKIEITWNNSFNSTIEYDTSKVPIGFRFTKFLGEGMKNDIRPEKRQAIAYWLMRGSCLFAYGVGIGKTWCSIFTIAQAMELGLTKRPLIIVPKQVYVQFSKEIKKILGNQYKINTLYNLSDNKDKQTGKLFSVKGKEITDNSISICTYDALENLGFSSGFDAEFYSRISGILNEENDNVSARQKEKTKEKYEQIIGKAKEGGFIEIDSPNTNFDFVAVDEAHNFKKLFVSVKGEAKGEQGSDRISREKHPYKMSSGTQSKLAIKLFFITQYIQSKEKTGNCLLLTATPFTNSPLEIYSMLSFINYNQLVKTGFYSLKSFFDTFADMQTQLTINTQLQPVRKQVFVGFNNVVAMQNIIFNFIDKKSREDEDKLVERPNKIVLPFKNVMKNGINYPVAEKNRISTTLSMTDEQSFLADRLKQYAAGKDSMGAGIDFEDLCLNDNMNTTKFGKLKAKEDKKRAKKDKDESDQTLSTTELEKDGEEGKNESAGVRSLQCLTYMRQLALNPYLYACSGYSENPTYKQFVQVSPKMLYTFECIKSVMDYEKENGLIISGQVVYMDFGTDAFPLLVEYAVKELGYKENEVGFITGTESRIGKKLYKDKADVQDFFLGRKFNEDIQEYEIINDRDRCKLLFGSSSIREGMNLQFYASTLYNLYIDFNPTDNTQLEGRIWRQGNRFDNVRIVVPLMENSMDIFMFQKLEEKTERINQIWNRDGQTNELNTEDFNPADLKYELITDPLTLAKLQVDDQIKLNDEKIDDLVQQTSTLTNFLTEYDKVDDLTNDFNIRSNYSMKDNIQFHQYAYLTAIRPDLVPLPFLKETAYDFNTTKGYNDYKRGELNQAIGNKFNDYGALEIKKLNLQNMTERERNSYLNYSVEKLIELIKQAHKDKKFSFPPTLKIDVEYSKGDKVVYQTKRGTKDAIVDNVNNDGTLDLAIGDDFVDEVPTSKVSLKKGKKVDFEPFNPFTKDDTNLNTLIQYVKKQENPNDSSYREFYADTTDEPSGNVRNTILRINREPISFDNFQEFRDSVNYNVSPYSSRKFWDIDMPLTFSKIETFEKNSLRPLGINNKDELVKRIEELKKETADLEVESKAFTNETNLQEEARLIQERLDNEMKAGIRKPSTYKSRAAEFASVNSDYSGNEYLLILSEKELIATTDTLTELRKTEKYKELSKDDRKKFEDRFTEKKSKTKQKAKKQVEKVLSVLDKRIKATSIALRLKPKDKKLKRNLKALQILKRLEK